MLFSRGLLDFRSDLGMILYEPRQTSTDKLDVQDVVRSNDASPNFSRILIAVLWTTDIPLNSRKVLCILAGHLILLAAIDPTANVTGGLSRRKH